MENNGKKKIMKKKDDLLVLFSFIYIFNIFERSKQEALPSTNQVHPRKEERAFFSRAVSF